MLTADDAAERERARRGFDAWKQADPRHAAVAASMESLVGRVRAVRNHACGDPRPARAALNAGLAPEHKRGRGKRVGAALAVALALVAPIYLTVQSWPPSYLIADMRTATGQWETRTLADGTHITLNSASAVNLRYDDRRRTVELVRGEILVDVARDAARPFLVETRDGSIRALGTRFVVERQDDSTVLTMLESKVAVQTARQRAARRAGVDAGAATQVSAGERARITPDGVGPIEEIDARSISDAWRFHQLVVNDRPLSEVLDELARQRPGRIQYDRARINGIRVSAVLPLDDTDRALQLLVANFPQLRVRTLTPYLVLVDTQSSR